MIDSALMSQKGGRLVNEDYVAKAIHGEDQCFVLCDGLGGHERGDLAAREVATCITDYFEQTGGSFSFLDDAINMAQEKLLIIQRTNNLVDSMKTTLVVLVVTGEYIKWAHIGDSRLYRVYSDGTKYQRTKDHSLVQQLADRGVIKDEEIRNHPDRNKLLRAMGASWERKSYDKSAILERGEKQGFVLMTDGFWEYVYETEIMESYNNSNNAKQWLDEMEKKVLSRADLEKTDNYSAICVMVNED